MYKAYITTICDIRKHENADRLQVVTVFGNNTIVDMSYHIGQKVVYFPVGGQVSEEFATQNNLVRVKDENGNNTGGFLDPNKRNITAIRLRGEKSDGLILPIECLSYCTDVSKFKDGDCIDVVNGHEICKKYIPVGSKPQRNGNGKEQKPKQYGEKFAPLFEQHVETEQLTYNLKSFNVGDQIDITLKMHGTSQRTGYLPVISGRKETRKEKLLNCAARLLNKFGFNFKDNRGTAVYDWGYVSGTRRTILGKCDHDFYGNDNFRTPHAKFFEGKLHKGETVYYEVVGFMDNGRPIMPSADNKKTGDKEFVKKYGKTTFFSYGCDSEGKTGLKSDFYVYRMTMTNEDGNVVEYTPEFMRYRCEQMGAKCVPQFHKCFISKDMIHDGETAGDVVMRLAEQFCDGADPICLTHIREGVVVRIVNRPTFAAFKHKNFNFKVLAGIAIAQMTDDSLGEVSEDVLGEM